MLLTFTSSHVEKGNNRQMKGIHIKESLEVVSLFSRCEVNAKKMNSQLKNSRVKAIFPSFLLSKGH